MDKMKNSGIEWIGEIPDNWEVNLVKNIFDITRGRVIAKTEIEDEPLEGYYPVYSSQTANSGILGYIPSYDFAIDSLTWTTDGAKAGTVFLRRGKYSITNVCGILTLKSEKYSLDYLNYAVGFSAYNCRRADINGYKIMSNEMAIIPIVVPHLEEQQRISKHLDEKCGKLDELIANQEKQIEKLKEYKQSVITEAVTKGLDKSAPLKDSGIEWIGKISCSASILILKHYAYMKGRIGWQGLNSNDFIDEGPYCITGTDFLNGAINWDTCYHVSNERYEMDSFIQVKVGDLLITKDGTIGKLAKITDLPDKACLNSHLLIIRPLRGMFNNEYLYYVLSSYVFWKYYNKISSGAIMASISQEKLGRFAFPVFDIKMQKSITDYLDEKCGKIDRLIAIKQEKIEKLNEYKKSLIYEYVTGKKEVV